MLEEINIWGEIMTVLRNLEYSLDVSLAMEDNYYRSDIGNKMDFNGMKWPIIGFRHVGGSS